LSKGSLEKYLEKQENDIELELTLQFLLGISRGMYHLHCEKIIHRDLASRNVLLSVSLIPKISDFGMSRYLLEGEDQGKTQTFKGPLRWMSPESINKRVYSTMSDVYSYSMTAIEIVTRKKPFPDLSPVQVITQVSRNALHPDLSSIEKVPNWLKDLIGKCASFEPGERVSFQMICKQLESFEEVKEVVKRYNYEYENYEEVPEIDFIPNKPANGPEEYETFTKEETKD